MSKSFSDVNALLSALRTVWRVIMRRKGLTLVEFLVVWAIIAVLASIVMPVFAAVRFGCSVGDVLGTRVVADCSVADILGGSQPSPQTASHGVVGLNATQCQ